MFTWYGAELKRIFFKSQPRDLYIILIKLHPHSRTPERDIKAIVIFLLFFFCNYIIYNKRFLDIETIHNLTESLSTIFLQRRGFRIFSHRFPRFCHYFSLRWALIFTILLFYYIHFRIFYYVMLSMAL